MNLSLRIDRSTEKIKMLKKILPLFFIICCFSAHASDIANTKESLLERFLVAHEAKNYSDIEALVNWEGVRKYKAKMVRVYTRNNFGRKVAKTEFEEADTEFLKNFSVGNKKYHSNMPVTHLMRIYFENSDEESKTSKEEYNSVVYLVGKSDEGYKIAITLDEKKS
ncbi:hypothetical protein [Neptuniibacter sp. 2_MG-2023]|uniref:hypothetical protein n=1 Tax=Neptuniibacter sp. 2_MG-2023 TaxID=3062671 RepID=UPI0026E1E6D2|nr:hypothetical protein [Neptuniibacter sp. 2_MG-2023]MDO6515195.1 hypothetical protein [Neptuniibacter sp. 2_MG-2023]